MVKTMGIICLTVCLLCILWVTFGTFYTIPAGISQYRFDGVHAAEGTVLKVQNGELTLVEGQQFSVDRPLRYTMEKTLWGLCFLTTLISGVFLMKLAREKTHPICDTR